MAELIAPAANELVAAATFAIVCLVVAIGARLGSQYLFTIATFLIIASNVTVSIEVRIAACTVPLGIILYSLIYFVSDVASELYPRAESYRIAISATLAQIGFWAYVALSSLVVPLGGEQDYAAMLTLFGETPMVTFAGTLASVGLFVNIALYQLLQRWSRTDGERFAPMLWLRNILSTVVGQSINSLVFFALVRPQSMEVWYLVVASTVMIKTALALLDTPFLYLTQYVAGGSDSAATTEAAPEMAAASEEGSPDPTPA